MTDTAQSIPKKGQQYKKLFELSKKLMLSMNINEILQATVEGVADLAGLDTAAIYLVNSEFLRLHNTTPPLPENFPENLRESLLSKHFYINKAMNELVPVYVEDALSVPLTTSELEVVQLRNLRTLLFLPLVAETEVMGAFIIGSINFVKPMTEDQIDFSQMLANFGALALKNARLYQVTQRYAEELSKTLEERKRNEAEREKLREQLIQSQKMEAVGQLAGGIAHDFNNLLNGILGNAELIKMYTTEDKVIKFSDEIVTVCHRSNDLISQLLAFSRKEKVKDISLSLDTLVQDVVTILSRTITSRIEVKKSLGANLALIKGDPAQIQSAILNLGLNARDAMPKGGMLSFATQCVNLSDKNCHQQTFELKPGKYIELTVTDTGNGMDETTMMHIYEPFYTTKKQGEGTGLGLSAVYGTMSTHGGSISVESKMGQGTVFTLYFPIVS